MVEPFDFPAHIFHAFGYQTLRLEAKSLVLRKKYILA